MDHLWAVCHAHNSGFRCKNLQRYFGGFLKWELSAISANLNGTYFLYLSGDNLAISSFDGGVFSAQGQEEDSEEWKSQVCLTNFHWRMSNEMKTRESPPNLSRYLSHILWKYWLFVTHGELRFSSPEKIHPPELPESAASAPACYYFIERVERQLKEKQNLVIRGEIPAIWPAIREDSEESETSGRVSDLFAATAHVRVKADSSLNPLWTSLTACVMWNALLPPVQNFCHASQSGWLLIETMLFSGMWQRDFGICWLDASGIVGFSFWILSVQNKAARNYTEYCDVPHLKTYYWA